MTDLDKAIAELRRVTPESSPWEVGDIGAGYSPVDYHIATILNAVLSGALIPATERDAAVAAALERAEGIATAQEAQANKRQAEADDEAQTDFNAGVLFGTEIGARMIAREIRALLSRAHDAMTRRDPDGISTEAWDALVGEIGETLGVGNA